MRPEQVVVALDFDGVLNIVAEPDDVPPGFEVHLVELDRDNWPDHPYIRPLPPIRGPIRHAVVVNPAHGRMVRSWLGAGAAVVWATTWERAILRNAALCDIPDLPVLEISKVIPDTFPTLTAYWKLAGLEAAFPGHPLAWVDDFGNQIDSRSTHGDPPAPLLVVAPDDRVGLTEAQSQAILQFIAHHG